MSWEQGQARRKREREKNQDLPEKVRFEEHNEVLQAGQKGRASGQLDQHVRPWDEGPGPLGTASRAVGSQADGWPSWQGLDPPKKKLCAQVPMWKDDVGDALLVCPFGCSGEDTDASSVRQQVAPHPGRSMAQ